MLLFKTTEFAGTLISSEEGTMEWVDRHHLAEINTVDDFCDLLKVIIDPNLIEFQYFVDGDSWSVSIK